MLKFFLGCIAAIMGLFGCSCGSDKPAPTEFSVSANSTFVVPNVKMGTVRARIASFVLTASTSQGYEVNRLAFDKDAAPGADLQNLQVWARDRAEALLVKPVILDADTMTANMSDALIVPAGGSVVVDVYADVLMTAEMGTYKSLIDVTGWTVRGGVTGNAVAFPGEIKGQDIRLVQ